MKNYINGNYDVFNNRNDNELGAIFESPPSLAVKVDKECQTT